MAYSELATSGVLAIAPGPPVPPDSRVILPDANGVDHTYTFDPRQHSITSVREDIFAPGYFSMFDVILAVAKANGIAVEYSYDATRKTHFIDKLHGVAGKYWYHFSYDTGESGNEISYAQTNRWDELL